MSTIWNEADEIPPGDEHEEDPDYKSPSRIAAWFCRVTGIFHAVIAIIESADMTRRLETAELHIEQQGIEIGLDRSHYRKNMKKFRAEQANCQLLIAKQRDEIGILRGQVNAHRELFRELTKPIDFVPAPSDDKALGDLKCESCGEPVTKRRIPYTTDRYHFTFPGTAIPHECTRKEPDNAPSSSK